MVGVVSILLAGFFLVRSEAITLGAATAAAPASDGWEEF